MPAAQGLHGEDADAAFPSGGDGALHVLAAAVLDADALQVDQRVDHVEHREPGRGLHAGHEVGADAHGADVSPHLLFGQVFQGLLVAPEGVQGLLLVEHEQIDVVPPEAPVGPLQRRLGGGPVPAVGLGADHIVRRVLQR